MFGGMRKRIKSLYHRYFARSIYSLLRIWQPILHLKQRTFFDKFNIKTKDGITFSLYNNAFKLETELFWCGFEKSPWERKTREIWSALAKKSKVILDIGANTGIFSVLAKAYNPSAEVHAFEPQPNVYRVLKKNSDNNQFDIHCHLLALSDEAGELPFYNTGFSTFEANNTTHGSLNKEWRTEHQHSIVVKVERLDQFVERNEIGLIDLIKIDVETLEYEVLMGYGYLLLQHRPIIILEIQTQEIGDRLYKLLSPHAYRFFWINEDSGLLSVEELGTRTNHENLNYLCCPAEKEGLIKNLVYK
jgi:FkbM family methyltransferase